NKIKKLLPNVAANVFCCVVCLVFVGYLWYRSLPPQLYPAPVCVVNVTEKVADIKVLNVPRISHDYDEISVEISSIRANQSHSLIYQQQTKARQQLMTSLWSKHFKDTRKLSDDKKDASLPVCPMLPPTLAGNLRTDESLVSYKYMVKKFQHLHRRGRFQPMDCLPRQRLAVIIPFRNRMTHLLLLLNNLIPFLTRQQADATFFVVEQVHGAMFNKGVLLNAGFLEAMKVGHFDCFIFHDVDLIPLNDRNLYRCGDNPRHFSVAINIFSYSLYYPGNFGGVVGLSTQQYLDVNGYSNLYIGWGGEDDDMLERVMNKGYYISRYAKDLSKYDMVNHTRDKGNEPNPSRFRFLELARLRQELDGLTAVQYNKTIKDMILFTRIRVQLNNDMLMKAAPSYIQEVYAESFNSTTTSGVDV
ncbi:Beta-1,4-galactosyltransferase 1, partial [Bulinus truncatus]